MDLAKFTQIRPVQMGNAFELAKLHFRIQPPEGGEEFLEDLSQRSFAQTCEMALRYLQSGVVIKRANSCLKALSEGDDLAALSDEISIELPPEDVLHFAYRSCFAFPDITDEKGFLLKDFAGHGLDQGRSLESHFPDKLTVDLTALYLNPGVLCEYRTWLSYLLRLCTIFQSGFSMADINDGLKATKGVSGLQEAEPETPQFAARRLIFGKVLMPREFQADLPPTLVRSAPDEAEGLHSTKATAQLGSQFDATPMPAKDYKLAKVPRMSVRLTRAGTEFDDIPNPRTDKIHIINEAVSNVERDSKEAVIRRDIEPGEAK